MLSKLHRFHGYGSLKPVYQRGRSVRGTAMSLKYAVRDPKRPYRMAVVVSKKVSKSAVVRNRIRRRIFEAVRTSPHTIAPGTDLVFTVFGEQLAEMPTAKLVQIVEELLGKAVAS